ncbi:UNVERIFIED_ORG: hypothetical protein J2W74_001208 [Methylorubrum zatmanii]
MIQEISLDDLLPRFFDDLVSGATGQEFRYNRRDDLISSLVRSFLWAVVDQDSPAILENETNYPFIIRTTDGLEGDATKRVDIIHRMRQSTGLDESLCQLAITLMESSLASYIINSPSKSVFITELGKVSLRTSAAARIENLEKHAVEIENALLQFQERIDQLRRGNSMEMLSGDARIWARQLAEKLLGSLPARFSRKRGPFLDQSRQSISNPDFGYKINLSLKYFQDRDEVHRENSLDG